MKLKIIIYSLVFLIMGLSDGIFGAKAYGQANQSVSGRVTDVQSGETLPGVNILVKGTSTGASTDANGQYELEVESLQDTLVVSYVGYQTREISIGGRTELNIGLQPQAISGEEMVVVGYGTQKKENLTGSVSQISSNDIEGKPVSNTTEALQGVAPGLNVSVSGNGGESDRSMNLNIRGTGSLSGSSPYILIDGARATQDELSTLNPSDIESISVLKDAASAAIYGAQAAYGVILVKTKGGTNNQDFTVTYSNNFRFEQLTNVPTTVNSVEFAKVANEASRNYGGQRVYTEEQIAKMHDFMNGDLQYGAAPDPDDPNSWLGIQQGSALGYATGFANTDWWDVMFKDTKLTQKHNISVQGGSDNITYYLSGGFLKDPGQFKYGDKNEHFSKYNFNSNVSADITKWLKISNVTRFSRKGNVFPATLSGEGQRWRIYHDITRWSPLGPYKTPPVKDDQGKVMVPEQLAQLAAMNEYNGFNKYSINNLVSTLNADIDITKNLTIKGDFTFKKVNYKNLFNWKKWSMIAPNGKLTPTYQGNTNQIKKEFRETNYTSFNIFANYNKTFLNDHDLKILVGYQQEENNIDRLDVGRKNVLADYLNSTNVAVGEVIGPDNPINGYSTLGAFGRVQYNFKEKYLFEFNGRYDGSSRFSPDDRFVFSPSLSVGYNIYKEKFWKPIRKYINNFKIRASWGKLGNQDVDSYLYLSTIPVQTRLNWILGDERPIYANAPGIISPNITWETSTTKNIAADLAFLENRLSATVEIYERDTDNMFGPTAALPAVLGTNPPQTNSASLKTTGWELTLGWQDEINKDLSYNVNFLISDNQSTITAYNNTSKSLGDYYVGQKLGEIWGFKTDGLFQSQQEVNDYLSKVDLSFLGTGWQPGDVHYKDLNGNGKIDIGDNTALNPGDQVIIGNNHPRYQFSFKVGASWRNFDFSMFWQGVGKRDFWMNNDNTLFWGWDRDAHTHIQKASMDYWSKDNPDAYLPLPLAENGKAGYDKDRQPSSRYLQNGAYARLKNIQLGYSLPASLVQKVNIKNLRFFVNGQNLITITDMWPGIDPEIAAIEGGFGSTSRGRAYPLSRVYGLGINISF